LGVAGQPLETHERAIVRIIAPLGVLAGVLLLAAVTTFVAMTANPDIAVSGVIARLGSMPVVLALFALVTTCTLLDEQLTFLPRSSARSRTGPTPRASAQRAPAITLPNSRVLSARSATTPPATAGPAQDVTPWWAEWMASADPAGHDADGEAASRPVIDLTER